MEKQDANEILKKYLSNIERSLEKILPKTFSKKSLTKIIGPTKYDLDIEAINKSVNLPLWDFLDRGGKRWRPILFLLIMDLLSKNPKEFIDLATVFELIHNGTLIVDDIEDLSVSRRGKPTLHLIYGEDIAINAGNLLYFLPLKVLNNCGDKLNQDQILKIYQIYLDEMIKLSFGQATDIAWHKGLVDGFKITEGQYLQMCAFKTGGLSRMACKIAATVADASDEMIEAFGRFGETLGVIFQIKDDILNITESKLSEMKGLGDDITEGKRSLPVIYALLNLPKSKGIRLSEILLMHTFKKGLISEAINLIKEGNGIAEAQARMDNLFKTAWGNLNKHFPDSRKKEKLYNLAKFLVNRAI